MNGFGYASGQVLVGSLLALACLAVHAVRTHGWLFGCIWLGLPSVLCNAIALALSSIRGSFHVLPFRMFFPGPADVSLLLTCAFYLSAVLAKGFVERSRARGSPLALAIGAAAIAAIFQSFIGSANRQGVMICCGFTALCREEPFGQLGFVEPRGFAAAVVAAVFHFTLSYRLVSLWTSRNGVKLAVLAALLPGIAAIACAIGLLVT